MKIIPYDYQTDLMIDPMTRVLQNEDTGILAACAGSGKTIAGIQILYNIGLTPFVIAPKSTLPSWHRTAEAMEIPIVDAINIEKLRFGNTPFVARIGKKEYTWRLKPDKVGLIADEAHEFTGRQTLNAHVLSAVDKILVNAQRQAYKYRLKVLLMSATMADTPIKFADALGYLLGFHTRKASDSWNWQMNHGCYVDRHGKPAFPTGPRRMKHLKQLHEELFPRFGVCVKHRDIPGFPENQIITKRVAIKPKELEELQRVYDEYERMDNKLQTDIHEINRAIASAKTEQERDELEFMKFGKKGTALLRARQMSELAKVPHFVEMGRNLVAEGGSVIFFLTFKEAFWALEQKFRKENPALIYGSGQCGRLQKDREVQKQRFLDDKTRVCICMIQAGGVGIDLNDIRGEFPRYTLMSPPIRALHFVQAIGRSWRINSQSPSIQYVLIAEGTVEEKIEANLQIKCENMDALTDASFWG